jgi:hypothetical protein
MIKLKNLIPEHIAGGGIEVRPLFDNEMDLWSSFYSQHYLSQNSDKTIKYKFLILYHNNPVGIIGYGQVSGVAVIPSLNRLAGKSLIDNKNLLELRRLYIKDDVGAHNAESQAISAGNIEISKIVPDLQLIVTYADPKAGHQGTIYKATNAIYTGSGGSGKHRFIYFVGNRRSEKGKEMLQFLDKIKQSYS